VVTSSAGSFDRKARRGSRTHDGAAGVESRRRAKLPRPPPMWLT
jgi:hypothetical protein